MARFTKKAAVPKQGASPLKSKAKKPTTTYEGGSGFAKAKKTELYNRLLTERFTDTFYENANFREDRIVQLATEQASKDPVWFSRMIPYLRNEAHVRSGAVLCAAIYAKAQTGVDPATLPEGALSVREAVAGACARADDPVELVAAYVSLYGRNLPRGLEKGIGDAVRRLWSEYNVLKYNRSGSTDMRDVINLCHLRGEGFQAPLFRYIIDTRYNNPIDADELDRSGLQLIANRMRLNAIPLAERKAYAKENPGALKGLTWEFLSSWFGPGGMDADGWSASIPQMGYMAQLRNLRNFEQAQVPREVLAKVRDRIADPAEVAKSRQYPYAFYLAKKYTESDFFASALGDAFEASIRNLESLPGRTLVLVDGSGSMGGWWGHDRNASKITPIEQGGVLAAVAHAAWDADVWLYDTKVEKVNFTNRYSALSNAKTIFDRRGGGGTATWPCLTKILDQYPKNYYSRVIIFTDFQDRPGGKIPDFDGNIYVWDLAGYESANLVTDTNRHMLSGFDDSSFGFIERIEKGELVSFPWMES